LCWKTAPAFEERPEETEDADDAGASAAWTWRRLLLGDHTDAS
jgi:hypothetical protein